MDSPAPKGFDRLLKLLVLRQALGWLQIARLAEEFNRTDQGDCSFVLFRSRTYLDRVLLTFDLQ